MVCSPWMEDILQGKGFYLAKVIIFSFEDKEPLWIFTTGMHGMRIYVLCQESTNSINFPPARWVKELRAQRAGAILQGTKNAKNDARNWRKLVNESNCTFVGEVHITYSVLLKFLMFHSIARETTNQATTQIQSPTWQVYTLFPLWVGNLLPQGIDRSWYPDLIGLYIDMFW